MQQNQSSFSDWMSFANLISKVVLQPITYKHNKFMLCGIGCQRNKRAESSEQHGTIDSPLQIKLVKMLGLKNYLLDKFVFRRKSPSYNIRFIESKAKLILGKYQYIAPHSYQYETTIIQTKDLSVPVFRLKPNNLAPNEVVPCIIYAHGNSSDMGDSIYFISKFAEVFKAQFIAFEYTGYGISRKKEVGQEIICRDLELVIAWVNRPLEHIILWGFSLGSFPVTFNSAKYRIKACILQCPIGSLSCMFYDQYAQNVKFKQDHFANIDYITNVSGKILMMHSIGDQIIPIEQARLLYTKFVSKNKFRANDISFIEVEKINHNAFHRYIASPIDNDLQKEVFQFLYKIQAEINLNAFSPNETNTTDVSLEIPEIDLNLLSLIGSIKQVQFQEYSFDEQHFQIIDLNQQKKTDRKIRRSAEWWMCCNK